MDKEMKRQVLYDKKANVSDVPAPKKEKKELPTTEKTGINTRSVANKSQLIIRWLENHDLIKIRALCTTAGLDPGNFHRWINVKKELPKEVIEKITPILKDYGFEDCL